MKKGRGNEKVQPPEPWWHLSKNSIAIIISIISLIISAGQWYVQRTQIDELLIGDKPKYHLSYELIDTDNDNYEDNEFLKIKSYGREASNIKIYTKTFIRLLIVVNPFRENVDKYRKTLYIPINGYFNNDLEIKGFDGDITTDNIHNNYYNYFFSFFDAYCVNTVCTINENEYYLNNPRLIKFVIIDYEDTHERKHKLYFEEDTKITEEYYNDIVNQSEAVFHNTVFKIDGLKPKDVIKYIDQDKMAHKNSVNNYSRTYRRQNIYNKFTDTIQIDHRSDMNSSK